ncbi:MAG: Do family serine endopeptidase [Pseudomonadota bacterium]
MNGFTKKMLTGVVLSISLFITSAQAALPAEVDGQPLPSLAPLLERVTPAVVNVHTSTTVQVRRSRFMDDPFFRRFFDFPSVPRERERVQRSLGSGVIVDAEAGLVLTNNHVIDGADDILIALQDGREFAAEFIGSDRDTDLAVVRIDVEDVQAENLSELSLFNSDALRVGDFVVAVGNPFGLGQTVTSGIVSALGRSGLRGLEYQNFIQTDASINRGNSGGALVNLRGELVGINTAIFTPSGGNVGIGFAIPASTANYIMRQLIEFGEVRRGDLGVRVQDLTQELREALDLEGVSGALVTRVLEGSAADEAGLRSGDVITALDQRNIENSQSLRNIEGLLSVGQEVRFDYLRDGRARSGEIMINEDLDARISGRRLDARMDGLVLSRVPERSRATGVLIEQVRRNTPAWESGLRPGDLIVAFNRRPVENLAALRANFERTEPEELVFEIRRRGAAYLAMIE